MYEFSIVDFNYDFKKKLEGLEKERTTEQLLKHMTVNLKVKMKKWRRFDSSKTD